MSGYSKKELILCDYCQIEKDANQIYTARKQFAGCKIADILQSVTQLTIPVATPVKLCSLCASTLHATTGAIAKAVEMVSKLLPVAKKQKQQQIETVLVPDDEGDTEPTRRLSIVDSPKVSAKQPTSATPSKKDKKIITNINGTPTRVQQSPKTLPAKAKLPQTSTPITAVPSTPKKQQDDLEKSLQNSIKITTTKDVPKKNKEFNQLFGKNDDTVTDSEEEDGEEEEGGIEKVDFKNIAIGFECKLCDFTSPNPIPMKRHLKELHGQKRPRIYNCLKCAKSFGVLKSLKAHLLTHGITEEKDEKQIAPDPQLAVLTALKPKQKPLEAVANDESTFAVTDTNSSTPKPAGHPAQPEIQSKKYQCELCQLELDEVKSLQEHLKTVHNVDRPKVFKCDVCNSYFMYKKTLDHHFKVKHITGNGEGAIKKESPAKIKIRRKTVSVERSPAKTVKTGYPQLPVKIAARRKTVAAELIEGNESAVQIMLKSPAKNPEKEAEKSDFLIDKAIVEVLDELIEDLPMPKESKSNEDSAIVADKSKKAKKPTQMLKQSFESLLESPIKKKPRTESIQSDNMNKSKSKGEQIPATLTQQNSVDSTQITKKSKAIKDIDSLDSSQAIENGMQTKKFKSQKEVEDINLSESMNGSPKKSSKRKQREEESSQADTADESQVSLTAELKSLNNSKAGKLKAGDVIDLLDEINPNVKPHKRIKLDSLESELSCNVCSKVVGSRKRLDSHMRKKHTVQLTCPNCKVDYADNLEYVKHFSFCNAVDGLPCGFKNCEKVFAAANFLSSHLNKKHKGFK
ncbi:zinc finger protein CG2199 [Drosophila mojavensis]|uniref:C2H2-type domain-containing protein n=1 Tax=Drosophila mojavensis TaxID=7230 RepID=B4KY04_DROMO|nr:zinc finger protein CG2199 [Drosophila mojavensis]EDW18706.1 uncharacterized protein Dmoj_GI13373 [Drosophila mojavensis]